MSRKLILAYLGFFSNLFMYFSETSPSTDFFLLNSIIFKASQNWYSHLIDHIVIIVIGLFSLLVQVEIVFL